MGFAQIIGQQRTLGLLRQALTRGNLPHAFLFTGMEGVGKRLTAFNLAKAVNCENDATGDCCDSCLSCRKVESGNHPDIHTIECEGSFIKIDQVRALHKHLRFRPLEGRYRVILIDDAQNLTTEAANALLKILEEPPPENLLILTAYETTALLPTIVSRCLQLRFQPLAAAAIAAYLARHHGLSPEHADIMASLAGGSLSRALYLLDESQLGRRRQLLETAAQIQQSQVTDLLTVAAGWKGENADFIQDLEWLKTWTRDLLVHRLGIGNSEPPLNPDFAEHVAAAAPQFHPDYLLGMFELLCLLQKAMRYNINKRLSLEVLLLVLRNGAMGVSAGSGSMQSVLQGLLGK